MGKDMESSSDVDAESIKRKLAIYIGVPDPDSIGSGMGVAALFKKIAEDFFDKIDIIFAGTFIPRQQNKAMVNVLGVKMIPFVEASSSDSPIQSRYTHFVFVDCIPREKWCQNITPLLVLDHHADTDDSATMSDVRATGSCCSIVYDYLNCVRYEFGEDDQSAKVATGLFFGIQTDTKNFTTKNCTDLDLEAFASLAKHIDREMVSRIMTYNVPAYIFEAQQRVYIEENHVILGANYVGFIGFFSEQQSDALDTIADIMLRQEAVDTCFICGVVEDNIHVCVRSENDSVDVDGLCKKMFGKSYGGGKEGSGRIVFPMGIFGLNQGSPEFKTLGLSFVWMMLKTRIAQLLK